VWSAPNYCYRCNNLAAIMNVKESGDCDFKTFKTVPESAKSVSYKTVLPYFL
jgi:serine/threonine-protein phosphatase 6 catalytic subunit